MPRFTDVWFAAEGGLGGDFATARVDAGFALDFGPTERETQFQLYVHLAETSTGHPPELGLVFDLNQRVSPAMWDSAAVGGQTSTTPVVVQPSGQERLTHRCGTVADFTPVLEEDLTVGALWDNAEAPLWSLELALRQRSGPGCAFISHPFVWNPRTQPLPWTLLQPHTLSFDDSLGPGPN